MTVIDYRINETLNPQDIAQVFQSSGINRPSHDLERLSKMFAHSNLVISAWDQNQLIGVGRALTDFSYCCYLSDLAVHSTYQRQGIGRKMIEQIQIAIGDQVALILLSAPDAMHYYPKIGFEKIENGFVIKRSR